MPGDGRAGSPKKGLEVAHTPGNSEPEPAETGRDALDKDVLAIAQALRQQPEADQLDLLDGSPDLEDGGLLAKSAETSLRERRGRGRPKGSPNKRNADVFEYLEALGHRNPAVTLSLIQSMEPDDLARALVCDRLEAARLIVQAANSLMPYGFAKKPTAVEVKSQHLHVFMSGDLGGDEDDEDGGTMTIFGDTPVTRE